MWWQVRRIGSVVAASRRVVVVAVCAAVGAGGCDGGKRE